MNDFAVVTNMKALSKMVSFSLIFTNYRKNLEQDNETILFRDDVKLYEN